MFLKPQKLGNDGLSEEELLADRKNCKKIGPCGVGNAPPSKRQLCSIRRVDG